MLQKILLVLLVLATGFAVSGVSAVVLAQVKSKSETELTTVSSAEEPREVRLVVVSSEALSEAYVNEIVEVEELEEASEENTIESKRSVVKKVPKTEVEELVKRLEKENDLDIEEEAVRVSDSNTKPSGAVFKVPFYSQFTDITPANWKKVSCGIAGVAMLIDFYSDDVVSPDKLLQKGIAAGAFLSDAGWTHQGLINLTKEFGLNGESVSLAGLSMTDAFNSLKNVVEEGPVMVSVHYTFEPTNPIPHLVVVNGVKDGKVFYNDPAEPSGGGSLSIAKFQSAWKKRYIYIRPV